METTKIALITGGSRGLGKNTALQLAKKGTDVILTYRTQKEEADNVVKEIQNLGQKAIALPLDVADNKAFDTFIQTVSDQLKTIWNRDTFDFLINNAGIESYSLVADTKEEEFDSLLQVHFKGVYFLTQKSLPLLAHNGRIVNFSTGLARFSTPGYAAYASMKGAIETFTKYLAKEVGSRGITVNAVAPGPIETDFTKGAFEANPQLRDILSSQTALGRIGQPDDIGGVVAFLCSEEARWITAQRIEVSGGLFL
ncbi:SDR family oxidoreductase [Cytophagaceae bacterium DM2B3-1]|uniref:SDR family oxidoreductase n=1 Tax=Xanthocytophaga flava TaxID=3048013 RepID=A0ABT7CLX6_9BACT|nr:SDR family oxidoreductase [Xanthocytophaga flavus]MDJ1494731.1 SDR family oxidoreductase [Xanthocytophaga flavus]